jgi:hypothetical protein
VQATVQYIEGYLSTWKARFLKFHQNKVSDHMGC